MTAEPRTYEPQQATVSIEYDDADGNARTMVPPSTYDQRQFWGCMLWAKMDPEDPGADECVIVEGDQS